jgi:NADPH-ferrihemoprotein reductase
VYYGSQTGTAQAFARQIADESESRGFLCDRVVDLQDVVDADDGGDSDDPSPGGGGGAADGEGALIRATLARPRHRGGIRRRDGGGDGDGPRAVFLVATYGEGEPTDSARQFAEIMRRKSGISNIHKMGTPGWEDDAGTPDGSLIRDVDYAVFGLGNRQYEHYRGSWTRPSAGAAHGASRRWG